MPVIKVDLKHNNRAVFCLPSELATGAKAPNNIFFLINFLFLQVWVLAGFFFAEVGGFWLENRNLLSKWLMESE